MLTNEQMIAGRFAKRARSRKLLARMNQAWDKGGFVRIGTALRYTDLQTKHRDMVREASGSLYMQRGKRWDCIDYCSFQFTV